MRKRTIGFPFGRLHPGEKSDGFLLVPLSDLSSNDDVPGGSETVGRGGGGGDGSGGVDSEGKDKICWRRKKTRREKRDQILIADEEPEELLEELRRKETYQEAHPA